MRKLGNCFSWMGCIRLFLLMAMVTGVLFVPPHASILAIGRGGTNYGMSMDTFASGGGADSSPSYQQLDSLVGTGLLYAPSSGVTYSDSNSGIPTFLSGEGDVIPPFVVKIAAFTGSRIEVTFSEPMGAGVLNPDNYELIRGTEAKGPGIPADSVTATGAPNVFMVQWPDTLLENGELITVTVEVVVEDVAGNPMGLPNFASTHVPNFVQGFQIPWFK